MVPAMPTGSDTTHCRYGDTARNCHALIDDLDSSPLNCMCVYLPSFVYAHVDVLIIFGDYALMMCECAIVNNFRESC